MLEERLQKELVSALKEHNDDKVAAIRSIKAAIQTEKTNGKFHELTDADVIKIVNKQIKQRQESISIYKEAGRNELADKEAAELKYLEEYVPKKFTKDELFNVIQEIRAEVNACSISDRGAIMKVLSQKYAGQYDGKEANDIIVGIFVGNTQG
jgi:hypothetical protein